MLTKKLSIRISPDLHEELQALSRLQRRKVSDVARLLLLEALQGLLPEPEAARSNAGGRPDAAPDLGGEQ